MTATTRGSRLVLITLLGTVLAMPAAMPTANAAPLPSGQIAGTVTGAGGVVLPGTPQVKVIRWDEQAGVWDFDGPWVDADSQGHYVASGLVAGTYRLSFQPHGADWLSEYWDDARTFDTATDLVLSEGEQRTGVDAELRPAARIIGTVHGPDGSALTRLDVLAWPSGDGPPNGHGRGGYSLAGGGYQIAGLEPGTYVVQLIDETGLLPTEFWNDAPTFGQATDIVVGLGQTVTLGDSVLGVAAPPVLVANTAKPTITGRPVIGRRLTAKTGSWSPAGVSYAYQWFAGGKAIKGATTAKLKLTTAERGKKITVQVTASASGATSATVASKATKKVQPKPKPKPDSQRHAA